MKRGVVLDSRFEVNHFVVAVLELKSIIIDNY